MASSCRIFVGNIPYNATEGQVKALCEEVGPVVSFRIVTDKDTGKPKGFGFCEYRDESTAFSALRNLQDCELNGRRLKVNFAANEKSNYHPIGLQAAVDAAATMGLASDALTVYLSKMSRNQLAQMVSEMKGIAVGNKEMAQELLLAKPQLNRALLQAHIMLGMVTPQMMEKANMRPLSNVQPQQQLLVPKPEPQTMVTPQLINVRPLPNVQPQQQLLVPKPGPVQVLEPQNIVAPQMMQKGPMPKSEQVQISEPQTLPAGVDAAMLQQVVSLPPETVASLAPELRQQVIQIQQMYRQGQMML